MIADALLDLRQVAISAYYELNALELGAQAGHRLAHVMSARPRSDAANEAQAQCRWAIAGRAVQQPLPEIVRLRALGRRQFGQLVTEWKCPVGWPAPPSGPACAPVDELLGDPGDRRH